MGFFKKLMKEEENNLSQNLVVLCIDSSQNLVVLHTSLSRNLVSLDGQSSHFLIF